MQKNRFKHFHRSVRIQINGRWVEILKDFLRSVLRNQRFFQRFFYFWNCLRNFYIWFCDKVRTFWKGHNETIFHLIWHFLSKRQIKWKIVSNFLTFLKKLNCLMQKKRAKHKLSLWLYYDFLAKFYLFLQNFHGTSIKMRHVTYLYLNFVRRLKPVKSICIKNKLQNLEKFTKQVASSFWHFANLLVVNKVETIF